MSKYIIYSDLRCTYCNKAKKLLRSENIEFEERHLSNEVYKKFLKDNG